MHDSIFFPVSSHASSKRRIVFKGGFYYGKYMMESDISFICELEAGTAIATRNSPTPVTGSELYNMEH